MSFEGDIFAKFVQALREGLPLNKKQMKTVLDELWELDPELFEAAGYGPYDDEE